MAGYRGDGYGAYGDHGDDDYRFGDGDRGGGGGAGERSRSGYWDRGEPRHGAAHGNLLGSAEQRVRDWFEGDDDGRDGDRGRPLAEDPRAVRAADDWRSRYGREGFEGSYAQHDDPYHSFRQRHIDEMDRDYQDWCREHGHQFNQDFDGWRQQRVAGSVAREANAEDLLRDESSGPQERLAGSPE